MTTTQTLSFTVTGEGLTNLIRETFVEGRLLVSYNILKDSGAPEHFWLKVCTGEVKITGDTAIGDHTLSLSKDNTNKHNNFDISLEKSVKRLEKQYAKLQVQFVNAETRIRYFTMRADAEGVSYKTNKLFSVKETMGRSLESDKIIIERIGGDMAEMELLFSKIYPHINKKIEDYNFENFIDVNEIFVPDLGHPYYLPNMRKRANRGEKQPSIDGKVLTDMALDRIDTNEGELINTTKAIEVKNKRESKKQEKNKEIFKIWDDVLVMNEGKTKKWKKWFDKGGRVDLFDYDITEKIPIGIGHDTIVVYGGKKYYGLRDNSKKLELEISTFRGISTGAVHYYGTLKGPGFSWKESKDSKTCAIFSVNAEWTRDIKIRLTKKVEQWEIDKYPDKFKDSYDVGDDTHGFWTKESVIEKAKEIFDKWFAEMGWELIIND